MKWNRAIRYGMDIGTFNEKLTTSTLLPCLVHVTTIRNSI